MALISPTLEVLRARYRAAAQALDQAQLEELAALSDEEALSRTLSLEPFAEGSLPSRTESGLVELQTILKRARPA